MPPNILEDRMIAEIYDALMQSSKGKPPLIEGLAQLHEALLEVPVGSGKDAKPLLERVRDVVILHERASWSLRAIVWIGASVATLAGGWAAFRGISR
jgi:hypothetical protein